MTPYSIKKYLDENLDKFTTTLKVDITENILKISTPVGMDNSGKLQYQTIITLDVGDDGVVCGYRDYSGVYFGGKDERELVKMFRLQYNEELTEPPKYDIISDENPKESTKEESDVSS